MMGSFTFPKQTATCIASMSRDRGAGSGSMISGASDSRLSPYWVDGRVFLGTDDGDGVVIFAHGRTAKVLATIDFDEGMATTPVAANGVLYVMTGSQLYAIACPDK